MPDLPTLTVTQTQADRILAAYGSVAAYRKWLENRVKEFVFTVEADALRAQIQPIMDKIEATETDISKNLI